jgi:hypothetical protein
MTDKIRDWAGREREEWENAMLANYARSIGKPEPRTPWQRRVVANHMLAAGALVGSPHLCHPRVYAAVKEWERSGVFHDEPPPPKYMSKEDFDRMMTTHPDGITDYTPATEDERRAWLSNPNHIVLYDPKEKP